jgi:2-deoxy-D-gluconate 3-dehydrogenase
MKSIKELYDLTGQTALVTGGAMGIGKAIATRLAEAGASVVIADISMDNASKTVQELKTLGYKVAAIQADASKVEDATRAVDETVKIFGGINIMVNNAGIYPFSPAMDTPESLWDKTIDINLKGTMFFAQAAARKMKAGNHGGKIINIASIDAFYPTGNVSHYDASKGGVVMLTKALAKEWGPMGITVNAVAPGSIATPGTSGSLAGISDAEKAVMIEKFMQRIPVRRMGEPDDIAKVVLFLASGASDYITGVTIPADGGFLVG